MLGGRMIPGLREAAPNVDNEFRFFGAWYAAAGLLILRSVRRGNPEAWLIRGLAGTLAAAASARLLGWAVIGRPTSFQLVLMGIEYALAVVLLIWQASAGRAR